MIQVGALNLHPFLLFLNSRYNILFIILEFNFNSFTGNTKTNTGKAEVKHKPLADQAADLTSVFDRITALRRSASAAQIFIARHIVINTLSFLAVR